MKVSLRAKCPALDVVERRARVRRRRPHRRGRRDHRTCRLTEPSRPCWRSCPERSDGHGAAPHHWPASCLIDKPAGMTSHDVVAAGAAGDGGGARRSRGHARPDGDRAAPRAGRAVHAARAVPVRRGEGLRRHDRLRAGDRHRRRRAARSSIPRRCPPGSSRTSRARNSEILDALPGTVHAGTAGVLGDQGRRHDGAPRRPRGRAARAGAAPHRGHDRRDPAPRCRAPARGTCSFRVSKGTYIRSLARDIGKAAGTVAHLAALRRTDSLGLVVDDALTLDEVAIAAAAGTLPDLFIDTVRALPMSAVEGEAERIATGKDASARGWHLMSATGELVAVTVRGTPRRRLPGRQGRPGARGRAATGGGLVSAGRALEARHAGLSVAASRRVGVFDGVHIGHQALVSDAVSLARATGRDVRGRDLRPRPRPDRQPRVGVSPAARPRRQDPLPDRARAPTSCSSCRSPPSWRRHRPSSSSTRSCSRR